MNPSKSAPTACVSTGLRFTKSFERTALARGGSLRPEVVFVTRRRAQIRWPDRRIVRTESIAQRVALQELVLPRHAELLESWLRRPHVIRWWGEQGQELTALLRRPPGSHALIVADGVPVGYLCWGPPAADELAAAGLMDLPDALVDIDILIGEPQFVGHGIGPRALCLLLDRLRTRSDVRWAGVGTARSNQVAIAAFEKAGCRLFTEFEDPDSGPCKYMVVDLREPAVEPVARAGAGE